MNRRRVLAAAIGALFVPPKLLAARPSWAPLPGPSWPVPTQFGFYLEPRVWHVVEHSIKDGERSLLIDGRPATPVSWPQLDALAKRRHREVFGRYLVKLDGDAL